MGSSLISVFKEASVEEKPDLPPPPPLTMDEMTEIKPDKEDEAKENTAAPTITIEQ